MLANCLYVMIAFGAANSMAGPIMGRFIDSNDNKKACILNSSVITVMILITIWSILNADFNALSGIMCFLWGIQDGFINVHSFNTLGFEFDNVADGFAVFNIMNGFGVFTFQLIQAQFD